MEFSLPKKGLIIKEPWLNKIFYNHKIWEVRGSGTKVRGRIGLIQSGSGKVMGECEIVGSFMLSKKLFNQHKDKHQIDIPYSRLPYNHPHIWIINPQSVKIYENPITYSHKQGAIIWVNLEENNE